MLVWSKSVSSPYLSRNSHSQCHLCSDPLLWTEQDLWKLPDTDIRSMRSFNLSQGSKLAFNKIGRNLQFIGHHQIYKIYPTEVSNECKWFGILTNHIPGNVQLIVPLKMLPDKYYFFWIICHLRAIFPFLS